MASFMLGPDSRILPNAAAITALFPAIFGPLVLIRPHLALQIFETPTFTTTRDDQVAQHLMRTWAARELFMGGAVLTGWFLNDRRLMGYLMLLGTPIVIMDGYVQKQFTSGGEWRHWPLVPVMATIGAGLLGWLN